MTLVVLAEPTLRPGDRTWIDGIRRRHDPQVDLVPPHLTFVFPNEAIAGDALALHVTAVAAGTPALDFRLRLAMTLPGLTNDAWFVGLIPEEGFAGLVLLYERLHEGPLAASKRLDIPYLPHLTVARFADAAAAQALAATLNARPPAVAGRIDRLTLSALAAGELRRLAEAPLGGPVQPKAPASRRRSRSTSS